MSTSTSGKVMQELIKNEEKYIKTLKVLKQCFLTPLKYAQDEPVRVGTRGLEQQHRHFVLDVGTDPLAQPEVL
eukprot:690830-Amorphochlora_amoeboformis.AAC.1